MKDQFDELVPGDLLIASDSDPNLDRNRFLVVARYDMVIIFLDENSNVLDYDLSDFGRATIRSSGWKLIERIS